jgi:hypothetical protein
MRAIRNLALGATGAVGALKGLQMLANDDLDDVEYALNKLKARVLSSFGSPSVIYTTTTTRQFKLWASLHKNETHSSTLENKKI